MIKARKLRKLIPFIIFVLNLVTAPVYVPVIGDVIFGTSETKRTESNKGYQITSVYFQCNFHHSQDKLLYRVTWYENGLKMMVSDLGESQDDAALHLTETKFNRNGFKLGNRVG